MYFKDILFKRCFVMICLMITTNIIFPSDFVVRPESYTCATKNDLFEQVIFILVNRALSISILTRWHAIIVIVALPGVKLQGYRLLVGTSHFLCKIFLPRQILVNKVFVQTKLLILQSYIPLQELLLIKLIN